MGSCLCEPKRLPVARGRGCGYDAKELSDPINALKRYLRSCIGGPWVKVHSELSRKLDRTGVAGSHIWAHVMWEIECANESVVSPASRLRPPRVLLRRA
jgi:hypothetical protein